MVLLGFFWEGLQRARNRQGQLRATGESQPPENSIHCGVLAQGQSSSCPKGQASVQGGMAEERWVGLGGSGGVCSRTLSGRGGHRWKEEALVVGERQEPRHTALTGGARWGSVD